MQTVHRNTGYYRGRRHVLGHWSDLSLDLKFILPLTVISLLVAMASIVRTVLVLGSLGSREDLGE